MKFTAKANANIHNSMAMFHFSVFQWKYSIWINLIQKSKFFSLKKNLVPRLT